MRQIGIDDGSENGRMEWVQDNDPRLQHLVGGMYRGEAAWQAQQNDPRRDWAFRDLGGLEEGWLGNGNWSGALDYLRETFRRAGKTDEDLLKAANEAYAASPDHNTTEGTGQDSRLRSIAQAGGVQYTPKGGQWSDAAAGQRTSAARATHGGDFMGDWGVPIATGVGLALGGPALGGALGAGVAPEVGALYSGLDAATLSGVDLAGAGAAGGSLNQIASTVGQTASGGGAGGSGSMGGSVMANTPPVAGDPLSGIDLTSHFGQSVVPNTTGAGTAGSSLLTDSGSLFSGAGLDGALTTGGAASGAGSISLTEVLKMGGPSAVTAVQKLLGGQALAPDEANILKTLGSLGVAGLGAYASNQQANSYSDLANKYLALGGPSRDRFEASMSPGFDPTTIPGYKGAVDSTSEAILRRLSATGGNPFGSPGGLIEANKAVINGTAMPAVNEYQRLNLAGGGQATLAAAAPAASTAAIGATGNIYNAAGSAISDITNPKMSLTDILRSINAGGGMKFSPV